MMKDVANTIFGLNLDIENAKYVVLPIPWDVTTSYGVGTANGPEAIKAASYQLDLYHPLFPDFEQLKVAMAPINTDIVQCNQDTRKIAEGVIADFDTGNPPNQNDLDQVNAASEALNEWVEKEVAGYQEKGQCVIGCGGEHSVTYPLVKAASTQHDAFGILQIDAHMDLRESYQGFTHSHASVMYNCLKLPEVTKLTQVGIRDYCMEENNRMLAENGRVETLTDEAIAAAQFDGETWRDMCDSIIHTLPNKVYITIDIDGLDPKLCPGTGTPVPGGLSFQQLVYLLQQVQAAGKEIVGADIVEVSPTENSEWDANVGARVLFHFIGVISLQA